MSCCIQPIAHKPGETHPVKESAGASSLKRVPPGCGSGEPMFISRVFKYRFGV